MKQSNIILGIGIIVAVILIAGSFFLKANTPEQQSTAGQVKPLTSISNQSKRIMAMPFRALSQHIIRIK